MNRRGSFGAFLAALAAPFMWMRSKQPGREVPKPSECGGVDVSQLARLLQEGVIDDWRIEASYDDRPKWCISTISVRAWKAMCFYEVAEVSHGPLGPHEVRSTSNGLIQEAVCYLRKHGGPHGPTPTKTPTHPKSGKGMVGRRVWVHDEKPLSPRLYCW